MLGLITAVGRSGGRRAAFAAVVAGAFAVALLAGAPKAGAVKYPGDTLDLYVHTDEAKEGGAAFNEKRPPDFSKYRA